ncbi:MAG TPA: hypothetical protein VLS89_00155 [Candidatus Nanopelagicales bacterium]|nr:hypothetical protein [Candidatus Nanopelagicales bacterium]
MAEPAKKLSADDLLPLAKKLPRGEQIRLARTLLKPQPTEPARSKEPGPVPADWEPPLLRAGGTWIGGSLRREEIYDDDGR